MARGTWDSTLPCTRHQPQFRLLCSAPTRPFSSSATEIPPLRQEIGSGSPDNAAADDDHIGGLRQDRIALDGIDLG